MFAVVTLSGFFGCRIPQTFPARQRAGHIARARMSANVLLRVPGAAVSVDPTPRTRPRHPLRKPRPLALATRPSRCLRCAVPNSIQMRQVDRCTFRFTTARRSGVGRCAKGACGAVGENAGRAARSRWVDDEAARGTRSPTRFAPPEAMSAAAHPAFETNDVSYSVHTSRPAPAESRSPPGSTCRFQ